MRLRAITGHEADWNVSERFWVTVLASESLAPGTMTPIVHGNRRIAIYNIDGEFYATEDIETQPLTYLTDGRIEGATVVAPPGHTRFDVKTGRAVPCSHEWELKTYPVRVIDRNVEIELISEAC